MDYTVWWGYVWGCSQQAPSARLEARPLGMHTPDAWLQRPSTGQAMPVDRGLGCNHLALNLPCLGRMGCLHVCLADQVHTWRLGWCLCEKYYYFKFINYFINNINYNKNNNIYNTNNNIFNIHTINYNKNNNIYNTNNISFDMNI
jgi:hypothetical protein